MNTSHTHNKGFTLVETLVAIGILLTAVAAPISIAQVGLRTSYFARDSLTAQMLASEAVEYVRNLRDDNFINDRTWTQNLNLDGGFYHIDSVYEEETACSGSCDDDYLSYRDSDGLYSHQTGGGWEQSRFARAVQVERVNSHEVKVTATVWWTRLTEDYSFTTVEHLFNWHE